MKLDYFAFERSRHVFMLSKTCWGDGFGTARVLADHEIAGFLNCLMRQADVGDGAAARRELDLAPWFMAHNA